MADFRVTFVGNLGNLAQFNAAIRSSFASNAAALRQANQGIVSRALGRPVQGVDVPLQATKTAGLYLQNTRTQFDHFNNSVVQSGQIIERYVSGYDRVFNRLTGKIQVKPIFDEAYNSSFTKATTNMQEYLRVTARLGPIQDQLLGIQKAGQTRSASLENRILPFLPLSNKTGSGSIDQLLGSAVPKDANDVWSQVAKRNDKFFKDMFASLKNTGTLGRIPIFTHDKELGPLDTKTFLDPATATWNDLKRTIVNSGGQIKTEFKIFADQIARSSTLVERAISRATAATAARTAAVESSPLTRSLRQYQQNLFDVPEGIDTQSYRVLQNQNVVRNDLIKKAGLGGGAPYGTEQFFSSAKNSEFQITDVSKDISSGLTRVSGQMRDANGVLNTFTYSIDKNQKVVDSWGRKLYSSGGFLNETASRLIRFTEFMVGATIVLGSFSLALNSVSKINELNASLQRFAITARLNDTELQDMFHNLAGVAQDTATPLNELVTAADDMAIATRRANQSTEEWRADILQLATAVGIFTNITGQSTTAATEKLVAIMQQLGLSTKELVPLLSQITAAAGGQAGSITDIAEALSSLSEAASEAGLTTTQQIAATQVISLATGKTADQTAVAFKALFGAINSDAAIKKLADFNIAVRDTQGNLRPFLDIYKEIQNAIDTGVIPQGRVNEVLRAIGGGPRRAPDAAALLANIGKVFEVERVAAGATNEALIANAQILTTNQAKITQFQSAWDEALYEKLNKTLEDLVAILAQLGTTFADVFGAIPQGLISFTTQLLAFYAAFSLLSKLSGSIGLTKLFSTMSSGFKGVATDAKAAATGVSSAAASLKTASELKQPIYRIQDASGRIGNPQYLDGGKFVPRSTYDPYLKQLAAEASQSSSKPFYLDKGGRFQYKGGGFVPVDISKAAISDVEKSIVVAHEAGAKTFTGKLKDFFSGSAGKAAALNIIGGGILGGASSFATGGSGLQSSAQAAQFASFGAFMTGNPVGIAAGLGLGGVSIILSKLADEEEKVKTKTQELQQTLFNLSQEWKINQAGVVSAQKAYDDIKIAISGADEGTDKYRDLQYKLGTASVNLAANIDTQRASLEKMLDVLKQLQELQGNKGGPDYSAYINDILKQSLTPEQLQELQGKLAEAIYLASGQGVYSSKVPVNFNSAGLDFGAGSTQGVTFGAAPGQREVTRSANELLQNINLIKEIFSRVASIDPTKANPFQNSQVNIPFDNPEVVSAIRAGLTTLLSEGQISQSVVDQFELAVQEFANATSVTSQSIKGYSAQIESQYRTGQLTPDEYDNAQFRIKIAEALQKDLADSIRATGSLAPDDRGEQQNISQSIAEEIRKILVNNSGGLNVETFGNPEGREALRGLAIGEISEQPSWAGIKDDVDAVNGAIAAQLELWGADQDLIDYVIGKIKELGSTTEEELKKMTDATSDWASGQLQSVGQELLNLQARLQGGEFKEKGGATQYAFLKGQLDQLAKSIIAVRDASVLMETAVTNNLGLESVSGAVDILLAGLNNLNINGFQGVANNVEALNGAFFNWIRTLNLSDKQMAIVVQNWIKLMALAAQAAILLNSTAALTSGTYGGTAGPSSISTAIGQKSYVDAQIASILKQMQSIGRAATGTYIPGTSTGSTGTKATTDTLYLSDEQEKLADPLALVKQAYQDALKLQAQIPGETKANKLNTVLVFDELQKIFTAKGVSEELLRKALDNLTEQMNLANQKANIVKRIHVGAGDFSAIANVPVNSATGVSVGSQNQINITFNLNGTALSPANFTLLANMIGAEIARRL